MLWASIRLFNLNSDSEDFSTEEPPFGQAVSAGAGIGLLSGIVGIGGGVFLSPLVLLKRWATPKAAAATAALFIWVNSAAALTGSYLSEGLFIDSETIIPFGSSVLVGGFIGSRLGEAFGAQAFGVTPDILTMAKAITNGVVPLGAVASREHIFDTMVDAAPNGAIEFFHGYTYSGT